MQGLLTDSAEKASMSQLNRAFGLSRAGLYSARQRFRQPKASACPNTLRLQAAFAKSGQTYGSRRLCAAQYPQENLAKDGLKNPISIVVRQPDFSSSGILG